MLSCCPGAALLFHLSSPAPDVYRIDVEPAVATTAQVFSVRSDTTSLRLDANEGRITIDRFDSPADPVAWSGTIFPITSFGRASVPGLELTWNASAGEAIYGAGERFDALNQVGKKVDFWIKDAPGQDGASTYYCTPVFYSSAGYGLFFTNNPEAFADFNSDGAGQFHYRRAGTSATFYIVIRPSIKEQIKTRAAIQGPYRSIPDWAWGPWISRNSYENQAEAEEAIHGMLDRGFPVAAIVQEAWKGSSEAGKFNEFSLDRWPTVYDYLEFCNQHGIRNILWQVPIVHPSHPDFAEAVKEGYFVRKPDGSVSYRKEWLEGFANVDFTNPKARDYWKNQMRFVLRFGIAGFKADDGEDIKPDDVFSDGRRGWEMHNEYSTIYNRTLTELLDELHIDGMLWSRSGSLGNETCPALWAGDQYASWEQLRSLLPAGLSSSISGMPFWGHDIGGYMGQPSAELYIRWLQFGAFSPLMQYHGIKRREPWEFGPDAEAAYKLLSHLRMNLKPTLIALGREAAETGMPIMRPMSLEFPGDPRFASEQTQYMLGPDLLVAPVLDEEAAGRRVKFPEGRWQNLLSPVVYRGPSELSFPCGVADAPVFVREGAVLKVQLAEDAALGTWSAEAPIRELRFGPERAKETNTPAPPSIRVIQEGSRVAGPGPRTIRTQVRNIDDAVLNVTITATPGDGIALATSRMTVVSTPRTPVEQQWNATFSPGNQVGERRVTFSLSTNETAVASFIRSPQWVVVGPFPAEPKKAYGIHFPPEQEQGADGPKVQWQAVPESHVLEHDGLDFNALFGQHEHAAAYAMTALVSDRDQDAELRFGSDDTLTVWLNDKQIYSVETYRLAEYDQEIVRARLNAGTNKVLVKVAQDRYPWRLMFRLTGPGGAPIEGVRQ